MAHMHSQHTQKGMHRIFVSYSRRNKVPVFELKDETEDSPD